MNRTQALAHPSPESDRHESRPGDPRASLCFGRRRAGETCAERSIARSHRNIFSWRASAGCRFSIDLAVWSRRSRIASQSGAPAAPCQRPIAQDSSYGTVMEPEN